MRPCSAISCCTFRFSLEFSSLRFLISVEWDLMVGFFSTTELKDVCITFRASLIDVSMVFLMLLFSLSSISDNSLSLLVVIWVFSLSSIFLISFNMVLVAQDISTGVSVILLGFSPVEVNGSGMELRLLLTGLLFPVDLLRFLFLVSWFLALLGEAGVIALSTINWLIISWSSRFTGLTFLLQCDVDMIHTNNSLTSCWYSFFMV